MKFGKRLLAEMEQQWVDQYMAYKELKNIIASSNPDRNEKFKVAFRESLSRINEHSRHISEDFHRVYHELKTSLASNQQMEEGHEEVAQSPTASASANQGLLIKSPNVGAHIEVPIPTTLVMEEKWFDKILRFTVVHDKLRPFRSARRAFKRVYRLGMKILRYIDLNREGFRKIMKKYIKKQPVEGAEVERELHLEVEYAAFYHMREEVEGALAVLHLDYKSFFGDDISKFLDATTEQQRWHVRWRFIGLALVIFIILLAVPILESNKFAHKCLAMMAFTVVLWITEAMPYFCTAMLIPVVAVVLGVIPDPVTNTTMIATDSSTLLLNAMFNHVQVLVLGGLSISKAIGKHGLEKDMGRFIHKYTAHRPNLYLLMIMLLGAFLSGFVSNVAAPVLVLGVIRQTLWALPTDSGAPAAILLGLAFSCNLGGMMTPIASPQNAVAQNVLEKTEISFLTWIVLSMPVIVIGVFVVWAAIILIWRPFSTVTYIPLPVDEKDGEAAVDWKKNSEVHVILLVCFVTLALWVIEPVETYIFGDAAIVALIPIIVFFGVGILTKEDFNNLSWHLIFLLAGGNMLGLCAQKSSLLELVSDSMRPFFDSHTAFEVLVVLVFFLAFITTFISHTVASLILLPIVFQVAVAKGVDPRGYVLCSVIMCSGAMAFPITSFPNVNSLLAEDDAGKPYLLARNYLAPGSIGTLIVLITTIAIVYPMTLAIW